jgi:hypothetical protein
MRSWTILLLVASLAWSAAALAEEGAEGAAATTAKGSMPAETEAGTPSPAGAPTAATDPLDDSAPQAAADEAAAGTGPALTLDEGMALEEGVDLDTGEALEEALAPDEGIAAAGTQPATAPDAGLALDDVPSDGPAPSPAAAPSERYARIADLGPEGVDEHGHRGRVHTVRKGDTLWDISNAYLGTPWVWPSVWEDNGEIENPHLILPGDHIWVTAGEMRKVTRDQAEAMIAADNETGPAELAAEEPAEPVFEPAADLDDEADLMADDAPAALDELPVAVPLESAPTTDTGITVRVAEREAMGFVSRDEVEAATSILDSPSPRTYLVDGDMIYLGVGEGRVEVGDEFTIFRDAEPVRDYGNNRVLGYHVDIIGWAVVRRIEGESAIAEIRMSYAEAERGDQVIPRKVVPPVVPVRSTPDGVAGRIVFMPDSRTSMGSGDYVYLNRGALHGFEVGSEVEVFTPGRLKKDTASGDKVMTPDRVDARMVLVEVDADTAVAYVVRTKRELEIGDQVRAAPARVARR